MRFLLFVILLLGLFASATFPVFGASGIFDQNRIMVENARLSDAEEMLQQWLTSHPEDQEARFLLARVLAWQKKYAEALEQYNRLLKMEPDNSDYLTGRSMLPVASFPSKTDTQVHPLGTPSQN